MRVIALKALKELWERHPDAQQPLRAWLREVESAQWEGPTDIKAQFGSASILKGRRVVFNIKGNDYRLVVALAYRTQVVFIKFVGTHKAYDAVDANTVEPG